MKNVFQRALETYIDITNKVKDNKDLQFELDRYNELMDKFKKVSLKDIQDQDYDKVTMLENELEYREDEILNRLASFYNMGLSLKEAYPKVYHTDTITERLDQLETLLKRHDWSYVYAEGSYSEGKREREEILKLVGSIGVAGEELYNQYKAKHS